MSQPTVVEHKQAFLRRQKQLLARGIAPSRKLLEIADEAGIRKEILGDILNKGQFPSAVMRDAYWLSNINELSIF